MNHLLILVLCVYAFMGAIAQDCGHFRITSPTVPGQHWTHGQCYSVDWDLGDSNVRTIQSIRLVNADTQAIVSTFAEKLDASKGTTGNVPLLMPTHAMASGRYFFMVNVSGAQFASSCTFNSTEFNVYVNPNSPPSACE